MPLAAKFGLSQYERIQSSSENAYRIALERMFRPRLMFRLEELLEANRNVPGFLYEALKVYLMLGGQQPVDRELVLQWMRRDWADTLYPGAGNAGGRKALEEHLVAMLDLEAGNEPLFTLHGPLIEETQKTLARLSVAQRAYELLKSQARSAALPDWVPARNGGPDFALVFGAVGNQDLESVTGARLLHLCGLPARLRGTARRHRRTGEEANAGCLGRQASRPPCTAQYDALGSGAARALQPRLHRGVARHARQAADAPAHHRQAEIPRARRGRRRNVADQAVARIDPRRDRVDARTPRHQAARRAAGRGRPADAAPAAPTLLRQQDRAPGAAIEAAFKAFHVLVEGDATRRPIDAIIANLNEIHQSLTLLATNPSQAALANAALQTQVASLRANANRLPAPFADLLLQAPPAFSKAT